MHAAKRCYNTRKAAMCAAEKIWKRNQKEKKELLVHSENIDLAAVKPILQLFVRWLCVVLACQVKMQQNIVNLV